MLSPRLLVFGSDLVFGRYGRLFAAAAAQGLEVVEIVDAQNPEMPTRGQRSRVRVPELHSQPESAAESLIASLGSGQHGDLAGGIILGEMSVLAGAGALHNLGLRGPGLDAAILSRDKRLQRRYLPLGPEHWSVISAEDPSLGVATYAGPWPAVIKPADAHSSIGVQRVSSPEQALLALSRRPPSGRGALIEEELHGDEYSVEAIVLDGAIVDARLTRKGTAGSASGQYFVEELHTVGPELCAPDTRQSLLSATQAVVSAAGVETAATHVELRVTDAGPRLMEIAVRPGGDGIYLLHHLSSGAPIEGSLLQAALGSRVNGPDQLRSARQRYLAGDVAARFGSRHVEFWQEVVDTSWPDLECLPRDHPAAIRAALRHKKGPVDAPWASSSDRALSIVLDAPTLSDLDDLDRRLVLNGDLEETPFSTTFTDEGI